MTDNVPQSIWWSNALVRPEKVTLEWRSFFKYWCPETTTKEVMQKVCRGGESRTIAPVIINRHFFDALGQSFISNSYKNERNLVGAGALKFYAT